MESLSPVDKRDRVFADRRAAGIALAQRLGAYADDPRVVVLGLPRGGVPVAFEVARSLRSPLDVFLVRKLGVPGHEELAMGAIATGDVRIVDPAIVDEMRIPPDAVEEVARDQATELLRRERLYREGRGPLELQDKIAILVDDGLATGASMRAAVAAARKHRPEEVVVAVPVASPATLRMIRAQVDAAFCVRTPEPFYAVGQWYEDFSQTSDDEVRALLEEASTPGRPDAPGAMGG